MRCAWTVPNMHDANIYPHGVRPSDGPSDEERAAHAAVTLFALHQQSQRSLCHHGSDSPPPWSPVRAFRQWFEWTLLFLSQDLMQLQQSHTRANAVRLRWGRDYLSGRHGLGIVVKISVFPALVAVDKQPHCVRNPLSKWTELRFLFLGCLTHISSFGIRLLSSLGRAVGGMAVGNFNEKGIRSTFDKLQTASSWAEMIRHARHLIALLKREDLPINYGLFAQDLMQRINIGVMHIRHRPCNDGGIGTNFMTHRMRQLRYGRHGLGIVVKISVFPALVAVDKQCHQHNR